MAMTECPECKKSISDKAVMCPHCGFPIKPLDIEAIRQEEARISMEKKIAAYHANEHESVSCFEPVQECPKCGADNAVDALMCIKCGYSFDYEKRDFLGIPEGLRERVNKAVENVTKSFQKERHSFFSEELCDEVLREYLYWAAYLGREGVAFKDRCLRRFEQYDAKNPDSADFLDELEIEEYFKNAVTKQWIKRYHSDPERVYFFLSRVAKREREYEELVREQLNKVAELYRKRSEANMVTYRAKQRMMEEPRRSGNFGIIIKDLPTYLLAQTLLGIQDYKKIKDIDRKGEKIYEQALASYGISRNEPERVETQVVLGTIMPELMRVIDECVVLSVEDVMEEYVGESLDKFEMFDSRNKMPTGQYGFSEALNESNKLLKKQNATSEDAVNALKCCPYNTEAYSELIMTHSELSMVTRLAKFYEYKLFCRGSRVNLDVNELDDLNVNSLEQLQWEKDL